MKKVLALALGMLLIPFTAFGMQTMSEADMDSVTGQSGVAISVDNIQLYTGGGDELWYETSYTANGEQSAAVGLVYGDDTATYLFINKIGNPNDLQGGTTDGEGNESLRGDYSGMEDLELAGLDPRQNPSVLSIRVAQHTAGGVFGPEEDGVEDGTGAYIEIGLPTLELYTAGGSVEELNIYVLGATSYEEETHPIGSGTDVFSLGTVWTSEGGSTTAILGGRIGITSIGQLDQDNTSVSYD